MKSQRGYLRMEHTTLEQEEKIFAIMMARKILACDKYAFGDTQPSICDELPQLH